MLDYGWSALHGLRRLEAKLIVAPSPEFYDLRDDPGEQVNLAQEEPERVRRMLDLLAERRAANDGRRSDLGRSPSAEGPELDAREKAEILKKLKSLGYVN